MESERYSSPRSQEGEELVHELKMQVQSRRSSQFNRTLLNHIEENPDLTIREAWEDVENHFTSRRESPRKYPFSFDN